MTPIERAARALEEHLVCGTIRRGEYKDAVRAVLTAIREPSSDMQYAVGGGSEDDLVNNPHDAYLIWQAMIDAALAEGV